MWIPCAWNEEGYQIGKNRPTDLDISEDAKELMKNKDVKAEEGQQTTSV